MKQLAVITSALVVLVGLLLLWDRTRVSQEPLPVNTRLGGDVVMTDQHGNDFDTASLRGKVVLKFFGFTHCPDICPATVARMSQVYKELGRWAEDVALVFITFDPERDTPEHLNQYLAWFHEDIIGLTGDEEQIAEVAGKYGVVYMGVGTDSEGGTEFAHSDFVYLLDREGRVRKLFPADVEIDEVVRDVRSLL